MEIERCGGGYPVSVLVKDCFGLRKGEKSTYLPIMPMQAIEGVKVMDASSRPESRRPELGLREEAKI